MNIRKAPIKRVTIDLDKGITLGIRRRWAMFILKAYGFKSIEEKRSPSGKGIHIIGWHDVGYPLKKLLFIRKLAMDDKIRIYLDGMSNRMINVLFDYKNKEVIKGKC